MFALRRGSDVLLRNEARQRCHEEHDKGSEVTDTHPHIIVLLQFTICMFGRVNSKQRDKLSNVIWRQLHMDYLKVTA